MLVRNLGFILGPSLAVMRIAPRPIVDGDGGDSSLKAIGQRAGGAEPLPRATDG